MICSASSSAWLASADLFGKALQPQDPRQHCQRATLGHCADAVADQVEVAALGHALDHLLGVLPGQRLIAGEVLGQYAQALGAQVQQRIGARVEVIELRALFQRLAIEPAHRFTAMCPETTRNCPERSWRSSARRRASTNAAMVCAAPPTA